MSRTGWLLSILFGLFMLVYIVSPRDKSFTSSSSDWPPGFSSWDGSHLELVKAVKNRMNDPSSFEHVETRYEDSGDKYRVIMKYRGRNAFGGVVTNYQQAFTSKAGPLIKLVD